MLRTVVFIIISTLIIVNIEISSQEKYNIYRGRKGKAVSYQLVDQIHLDESVNDIRYLPPDNRGLAKPHYIIKNTISGDVAKYNDKIVRADGNIIKEDFSTSKIYFSDNLEYFGRLIYVAVPTLQKDGEVLFQLFDNKGNMLFERTNNEVYEGTEWDYRISNNGIVLEIEDIGGNIIVLDNAGKLTAEADFRFRSDLEGGYFTDISQDGRYIALTVTDSDTLPQYNLFSKVILTDLDLNIIIEQRLAYKYRSDIAISPSAKYMITACAEYKPLFKSKTYIFDLLNSEVNIIDNFFAGQSKFYNEDDIVLFLSPGKLWLFDLEAKKLLYQYKKYDKQILAFDYACDQKLIFVLEGLLKGGKAKEPFWYSDVKVAVFNLNNVPAFELSLGDIHFKSRGAPFLSCSNDARNFILKIGDKIYTYQLD